MKIIGDFQTTVIKALDETAHEWRSYPGLVVCGTHSPHHWEEMIEEIKKAREGSLPFLGICFGHQLAAIEYARNVLGIKDATSEEFWPGNVDKTSLKNVIVKKLPYLKVGQYPTIRDRLDSPLESFWNNYEVKDGFNDLWKKEDNFITCQYHPEYQSSADKPHPLLLKFIEHARQYGKQ